jgi:hypothetical protein
VLEERGRPQDAAAARERATSLLDAKRFRAAIGHLAVAGDGGR